MTSPLDVGGVTVWPGWLPPEAQAAMVADIRAVVAAAPLFTPVTPRGRHSRPSPWHPGATGPYPRSSGSRWRRGSVRSRPRRCDRDATTGTPCLHPTRTDPGGSAGEEPPEQRADGHDDQPERCRARRRRAAAGLLVIGPAPPAHQAPASGRSAATTATTGATTIVGVPPHGAQQPDGVVHPPRMPATAAGATCRR